MMPPSGRATKPTPQRREGGEHPDHRVLGVEERRTEVERGGGAEADEVVALDDSAGGRAERCAADVLGPVHRASDVELGLTHGSSLPLEARPCVPSLGGGSAPVSMASACKTNTPIVNTQPLTVDV